MKRSRDEYVVRPGKAKVVAVRGRDDALVLGLDAGEPLAFVGAVRVRCVRGAAELLGLALTPRCPRGYVAARSPVGLAPLVLEGAPAPRSPGVR